MGKNNQLSRRKFLALSSGTLLQIGLPGTFITLSQAENLALASELRPDGRVRLPPGQQAVQAIQVMGGMPAIFPWKRPSKAM